MDTFANTTQARGEIVVHPHNNIPPHLLFNEYDFPPIGCTPRKFGVNYVRFVE